MSRNQLKKPLEQPDVGTGDINSQSSVTEIGIRSPTVEDITSAPPPLGEVDTEVEGRSEPLVTTSAALIDKYLGPFLKTLRVTTETMPWLIVLFIGIAVIVFLRAFWVGRLNNFEDLKWILIILGILYAIICILAAIGSFVRRRKTK